MASGSTNDRQQRSSASNYYAVLTEKTYVRIQFATCIPTPPEGTLLLLKGSLPQLTGGCLMKASSNMYQCHIDIEVGHDSKDVIDLDYSFLFVKYLPDHPMDASRPMSHAIPVFELPKIRYRLPITELLRQNTPDDDHTMKVVFLADRIESSEDTELLIIGTTKWLGELDYTKALIMPKIEGNSYQYSRYVNPTKALPMFWFSLVQKPEKLFRTRHDQETDEEPVILWSSGISTIKNQSQGKTLAVYHLFDKWNESVFPKQDSRLKCKICMEGDIQTAFVPCGHAATCWSCNTRVDRCPVCRADINQRIRIYL